VDRSIFLVLGLCVSVSISTWAGTYPEAERGASVDVYHGVSVADPYRWLEDLKSEKTKAWLAEEEKFGAAFFSTVSETEYFRKRLAEFLDQPSEAQPVQVGSRFFLWRRDGLKSQRVLYVQDSAQSPLRVLLDPNSFSETGTTVLAGASIAPDGEHVIYWTTQNGAERETYHLLPVGTGQEMETINPAVRVKEPVWIRSGAGFFYSGWRWPSGLKSKGNEDEGIYYHRIGDEAARDRLIVPPPGKEGCAVRASLSGDGRILLVSVTHGTAAENKLICLDLGTETEPNLDARPSSIVEGWGARYSLVSSEGSVLYLLSTYRAARGQLLAVDVNDPAEEKWKTIIPEGKDALHAVYPLGDCFLGKTFREAGDRLHLFTKTGEVQREIELPGTGSVSNLSLEQSGVFIYLFSSVIMPPCWFRCELATGRSVQVSQSKLLSLTAGFESRTVDYVVKDGTRIPLLILQKKGAKRDGRNPLILHGYGGFGWYQAPQFSPYYFVWMERGGIVAIPTLRGDGGNGESWHRAGTKAGKLATISDLVAAAEWLCAEGYTSPERLVISGGSNGAMVAAAAINQRPELFRAALLRAGPMDMLRWQALARQAVWKAEYGTSDIAADFEYLRAYSPLQNIKAGERYPACFVFTGDHDDRVHPAHSYKYVAALQAAICAQPNTLPVVLEVDRDAGHGLDKPGAQVLEAWAKELAFAAYFTMPGFKVQPVATAEALPYSSK
jgi:prolyl oligopeptidase